MADLTGIPSDHTPSEDRLPLSDATIDDGPALGAGTNMVGESSLETSSLLERSRVALMQQSRIALVALVDGTIAQLDADTQATLRNRLRLASMVLLVGFAVFLARNLFALDFSEPRMLAFVIFHAAITGILGLVGPIISIRQAASLLGLRIAELLIFGLPLVFFLAVAYFELIENCDPLNGIPHFSFRDGPWLVLMFTYALFIPNPLRRAAVVIGIIALTPLLMLTVTISSEPAVRTVVAATGTAQLVYYPMILVFCAAGSVFGVQTISTLRHAAYEARQLGQYKLKHCIGEGGMGKVYMAEHQLLKRPCVVKLINPEKAGDMRVLARFKREVRATAKLTHWNTVEIYDYGSTSDGVFYYVMEYLPGKSLSEVIKRFGPMAPERVVHLLRQACDALSEAHAAQLIHRDIKPGNIYLAERGGVQDVAKLLDFGLVKPLLEEDAMHLTVEGSVIGSPLYMSPEQATGSGTPDARSDIYSIGAVAYYLLTGHAPFEDESVIKVIMAHAQKEVEPPSKLCPNLSKDIEDVVLKCLEKKPEDRFQSAADLSDAFGECQDAGRWTKQQATAWWNKYIRAEVDAQRTQPAPEQAETKNQEKNRGEEDSGIGAGVKR